MLERWLLRWMPLFDGEGEGRAGGGAGGGGAEGGAGGGSGGGAGGSASEGGTPLAKAAQAAAGGEGGADGQGDDKGGGDPAAGPYRPEGLGDEFVGESDRETIDRLFGKVKGLPQPPESADKYELDLPEEMAKKFGDLTNDKVLPLWRETAHELGLSNDQFQGAFSKLYERMMDQGLIDAPIDPAAEFRALAPNERDPSRAEAAGAQRVNDVIAGISQLEAGKVISEAFADRLAGLAKDADGVKGLEALLARGSDGTTGVKTGGERGQVRSLDAIRADMRDPRYDSTTAHFDKRFRERVDAEYYEAKKSRG